MEKIENIINYNKVILNYNLMLEGKELDNNLQQLFLNCLNEFRKINITGQKAFNNLYMLIFIKQLNNIIDINKIEDYEELYQNDIKEDIDNYGKFLDFNELVNIPIESLRQSLEYLCSFLLNKHVLLKDIFNNQSNFYIGKNNGNRGRIIDKVFQNVIMLIHNFNFNEYESDILGDSYEFMVHKLNGSNDKNLGQHFTPTLIKNITISKLDIQVYKDGTFETIYDPACGSGGFLKTAYKFIKNKAKINNITINKDFISEAIRGNEIDEDIHKITKCNMIISFNKVPKYILWQDSLHEKIDSESVDIVVANPPFGISGITYSNLDENIFQIKTKDAVLLFLQRFIDMLKIGGKAGIILPNGKQMTSTGENEQVRELLLKTCNVKEIINIPNNTFEHTGVATCIMIFQKIMNVKDVLSKVGKKYIFNKEYQTKEIIFSDLNENSKVINIDEIIKKKLSLHYNTYICKEEVIEIKKDNIEIKTLDELCEFCTKSKRLASYGKSEGKYPFITSSQEITKYCDELDYKDDNYIIIGTGGNPNIHYQNNFSCSGDCIVFKSTKYIYYYLQNNINILEDGFKGATIKHISKEYIKNIKISIPSIEKQKEIVEILDYYTEINTKNEKLILDCKKLNELYVKYNLDDSEIKILGEVCEVNYGTRIVKSKTELGDYKVYGSGDATFTTNTYNREGFNILIGRFALSENCIRLINQKIFLNDSGLTIKPKNEDIEMLFFRLHSILFNKYVLFIWFWIIHIDLDQ
jgi:type I restriction enzyme S subunit